jgi:protein LTV1
MPRRKIFDKKNSTTFSLVYRAQNDPRIHDPEASDMVFAEKANPNANKIKYRQELEEEFSGDVRENEGEAANYGVFYDDTEYDYMQHLRDLGTSGEGQFVEAKQTGKGKQKVGLDEALKDLDLYSEPGVSQTSSRVSLAESLLPDDMLPSEFVQPFSYQNQQDVPDAIAGFQPDMDPRLREVLEALDDEAYVDDDEDIFMALQREGGEEVDQRDWERYDFDDITEEDEGWESDRTVKANQEREANIPEDLPVGLDGIAVGENATNDAWLDEFNKFKKDKDTKVKVKAKPGTIPADLQSSVQTGVSSIAGLKRKKRKGALTSTSGYSMTSSVLRRTDQLSTLDERFERIQEQYADDEAHEFDDNASGFSGFSRMSGVSRVSAISQVSNTAGAATQVRPDFDSIMDEFLGGHTLQGARRVRRGQPQGGLEQLDEIRKELGRPQTTASAVTAAPTS